MVSILFLPKIGKNNFDYCMKAIKVLLPDEDAPVGDKDKQYHRNEYICEWETKIMKESGPCL